MKRPSLAFILVALTYLLPEADYYVRKLNLPCPSILERTNHTELQIYGGKQRLLSYLTTTNYSFAFHEDGFLHTVVRRPTEAENHVREYQNRIAHQYCEIDTNGAYRLATQWLSAVDVDVELLERGYSHEITFPELDRPVTVTSPAGKRQQTRIVPLFWITWGKRDPKVPTGHSYAVQVEIIGPSKELASLTINDRSLSKRPPMAVPGQLVLLDLPDEPFTNLWVHRELSATNVVEILRTSTAYQAQVLRQMLDIGNWASAQLGLPAEDQLTLSDISDSCVVPSQFGLRGSIIGKNSAFRFDEKGKLVYLFHRTPSAGSEDSSTREFYEKMARLPMLVNSNSVVELATQWLKSLEVDVDRLSRNYTPRQARGTFDRRQPSHLWWVTWGETNLETKRVISVEIDGTTKNPDRIWIIQPGYPIGRGLSITNALELMKAHDLIPQINPLMPHLNVLAQEMTEK